MTHRDEIVEALMWHAAEMAPRLRTPDMDEVWASHGMTPLKALQYAVNECPNARVWLRDGTPICMFGVQAMSPVSGVGCPWMLTTHDIRSFRMTFLRGCAQIVDWMQTIHPHLMGWVDERNKESVAWLRWLGFVIEPAKPFGKYNMMFHQFERMR